MPPENLELQEKIHQHRLERTRNRLAELRRIENRFPWIRLGVLVILLLVIFIAFQRLQLVPAFAVVFLSMLIFAVITRRHQDVIDRVAIMECFQQLLETRQARVRLDWHNIPAPTPVAVPGEHPFAADLNITGERSLHQLLDTTQSLGGSQRLAGWLLAARPDPNEILRRQSLVRELIGRPAFRVRLERNGMLANSGSKTRWDGSPLLRWLAAHASAETLRPRLVALSLLALVNWTLFALNAVGLIPALWVASFFLYFAAQSMRYRETSAVFEEAYSLARQLGQLRDILTDLEDFPRSRDEQLSKLLEPLHLGERRPSMALRRIGRIVTAASLRNNPFFSLLLNILVPWDLFFAYQLERYKRDLQHILPDWLETWYELEALAALANAAALNPESTFPELLPADHRPVFAAQKLGHPLIPHTVRVTNDFTIENLGIVTIITGSNMSGKSTFLRTVGVSLVLAYAGGAVPARSLRVIPFRLFTSMNLSDSLNDGISYFYAEVRRLRALLEQLEIPGELPLFFLIDEIFRGTNNRERQQGSHAYTKALAGRNGVGLISTHDLELARLAEQFPQVQNRHFREDIRDGKMVFDYKIRSGPSPTTNALKIMALAGLPVPADVKIP